VVKSWTLKSESLVDSYRATRRYNSQDRTLYGHRCENLKPNNRRKQKAIDMKIFLVLQKATRKLHQE
jgi:hypothetical protein